MDYLIALLMFALSLRCMHLMYSRGADYYLLGVTGAFSIGYYVLPVFFKAYSGLSGFRDSEVAEVLGMSLLFFGFLYAGYRVAISPRLTGKIKGIRIAGLDETLFRFRFQLYWLFIGIWWLYVLNFDLTSYQSEDTQLYFTTTTRYSGVVSYISGISISAAIYITALTISSKHKLKSIVLSVVTAVSIIPLLMTAQRLAVIAPLFALLAALGINGMHKSSLRVFALAILVLLFVSPVMVLLREVGSAGSGIGLAEAMSLTFSTDNNVFTESFKSIMARSDLLSVMIQMKAYFEGQPGPGLIYYLSVLGSYVPRFIWPGKPYPLSDDGTIYGEISVLSWTQLVSPEWIGSLSAFGSLVAYREGGWLWIPFNGFAVGVLFVFIYLLMVRGGHIARLLFCAMFATLCVKNVPPSVFSLIVFMSSTVLLIGGLKLVSMILPKWKASE